MPQFAGPRTRGHRGASVTSAVVAALMVDALLKWPLGLGFSVIFTELSRNIIASMRCRRGQTGNIVQCTIQCPNSARIVHESHSPEFRRLQD